ncbi:hypothetical protein [Isoptericola hypogeus]|uniref:hypothetical protein n=1 Tax=Isoptericola hypogeus TaxID=300179 RepID=UPI0031DDE191
MTIHTGAPGRTVQDHPLRRRVLGAVTALAAAVSAQLVATAPAATAAEDPLCTTSTSSSSWYSGPSASRRYDALTSKATSRPIPEGLLDGRYVPQGMAAVANWDGTSEEILLISAYKDANGNKDPDGDNGDRVASNASAIFGVVATGPRAGTGLGRMLIATGHVGGLAVYRGYVYVGTEKTIRAYPLSTVRGALEGRDTSSVYGPRSVYQASYTVGFLGSGDGNLWAGRFSETENTKLNRYALRSQATGTLSYVSQYFAPKKTQGVAVTSNRVFFSTSYGRNDRGNIWVMPRGVQTRTDANSYCFRAPSMNEGVTTLGGRLWINYESGAYTYTHASDDPRNIVKRVHSASLSSVTALLGQAD